MIYKPHHQLSRNTDLFLTCTDPSDSDRLTYQIWLNKKDSGFVFSQSGQLPKGTGQISFADIDRDGTLDLVFPSCSSGSSDCYINIAYNEQIPLCIPGPIKLRDCRDANDLCVADPNFKFDLSPGSEVSPVLLRETSAEPEQSFARFPLNSILPDRQHLIMNDKSFQGSLPIPVRIGDYNQDGYPDLLVLSSAYGSAESGTVSLLQNKPCEDRYPGCGKDGRRRFETVKKGAEALERIKDARGASFLDIDEDVRFCLVDSCLRADDMSRAPSISWFNVMDRPEAYRESLLSSRTTTTMMLSS